MSNAGQAQRADNIALGLFGPTLDDASTSTTVSQEDINRARCALAGALDGKNSVGCIG